MSGEVNRTPIIPREIPDDGASLSPNDYLDEEDDRKEVANAKAIEHAPELPPESQIALYFPHPIESVPYLPAVSRPDEEFEESNFRLTGAWPGYRGIYVCIPCYPRLPNKEIYFPYRDGVYVSILTDLNGMVGIQVRAPLEGMFK